jgi:hypothetical protein
LAVAPAGAFAQRTYAVGVTANPMETTGKRSALSKCILLRSGRSKKKTRLLYYPNELG